MVLVTFALPFLLSFLFCPIVGTGTPFVDTQNGRIFGRTINVTPWQFQASETITVEAYTKIPYAEPPVGELRYKHPVKKVWTGEFDATEPNVACPQIPLLGFTVDMEESEDCLYLDVFVPSPRPRAAAVMVWIHGGGFKAGAGSVPEQLPVPLAFYGEVIVVTFNYRLAILGFLSTGDEEIPANLGLFDQREALIWVQENIAAFGGDPERVTIFGMSAGGMAANLHLISPLSSGLYNRAILQSGTALVNVNMVDSVEKTFKLGKGVGCDFSSSKDLVDCLRKKSWDELKDGYNSVFKGLVEFAQSLDGHFLPDTPLNLILQGRLNVDSVLYGDLAVEGTAFAIFSSVASTDDLHPPALTLEEFKAHVSRFFGIDDPLVLDAIAFVHSDSEHLLGRETDYFKALQEGALSTLISCAVVSLSNLLSTVGKTAYLYSMTHIPSHSTLGPLKWAGATHIEDIPYVFGSPLLHKKEDDPKGMSGYFSGPEEAGLSRQIIRYWSNFAKTGNPNLSSLDPMVVNNPLDLEEWLPFTNQQPYYKELDYGFPNKKGVKKIKECHFWNAILPKMMANSIELSKMKEMLADQVAAQSDGTCDGENCP